MDEFEVECFDGETGRWVDVDRSTLDLWKFEEVLYWCLKWAREGQRVRITMES